MDVIDIFIILLAIGALVRGREIGSIRQVFSTVGFFGGLLAGAWASPLLVAFGHTQLTRTFITLIVTLGLALIGLSIAEYFGELLKNKVQQHKIDILDRGLGSIVSLVTLLATVWLGAAILIKLPYPGLQSGLRGSGIISFLNKSLPGAPAVVADLGHVINPNGFPDVFTGNEPAPSNAPLPSLGELQAAVTKDQASVVKDREDVEFLIIGGDKQTAAEIETLVEQGVHVTYKAWVPFEELQQAMHEAALCLGGPFGGTPQANHVITGKEFQYLACGVATVVGASDTNAEFFRDKENALIVPQTDPEALAKTIGWAAKHREELVEIGHNGRKTYDKYFSSAVIAAQLKTIIDELVGA